MSALPSSSTLQEIANYASDSCHPSLSPFLCISDFENTSHCDVELIGNRRRLKTSTTNFSETALLSLHLLIVFWVSQMLTILRNTESEANPNNIPMMRRADFV